jgi:hypothetical protein
LENAEDLILKDGKKCPACGHINVPGAFRCGSCKTDVENIDVQQFPDAEFDDFHGKDITDRSRPLYVSEYKVARAISSFLSITGWLVVIAGVIVALRGLFVSSQIPDFTSAELALPGVGIVIGGLVLVATGQFTRATVDNADHTREILKLLKKNQTNI